MGALAWATPGSLTYQGRIKGLDGAPLEINGVQFEFSITNPTGTCIIYREKSNSIDMRNSGGVFDVPIGTGSQDFPISTTFKLLDAFDNSKSLDCEGGGTYSPVIDDKRLLRVQFFDGSGWKLISPDSEIRSVPYAGHAKTAQKLGTNVASDFVLKSNIPLCAAGTYLRHIAPAGTFECTTPSISGGNVSGNISGNAVGFTGALTGDVSGTQSATSVDRIKGVSVVMTGIDTGKVLKYNGSQWAPADDLGTTGALTGLTGDVSSTGAPTATVTINNSAVSTGKIADAAVTTVKIADGSVTSAKVADGTLVDADIADGAAIVDSKLATISTAGKVSGGAVTSGTIGGSTVINTSGLIQTSNGVRLYQGSKFVELKPPASLSADLSFSLPNTAGGAGQVLTNTGSGVLGWTTPMTSISASDVPNLAGDVTSNGGTSGTKVEKIQGFPVSTSTPLNGQTMVSNGSQWSIQYFGFGQLRSTLTGNLQMPGSCASADKTLTWSAITDTFSCTNISIANTQVSGLGSAATKNFGTSAGHLVELDAGARVPASLIPQGAGGFLVDGGNSTGAAINVGTNDANALFLETANTARMTIASDGNVGIGVTNPQAKLDVAGEIKVGNSAAACDASKEGQLRYNASAKYMEFCNGSTWGQVGGTPAIPSGAVQTFAQGACPTGWLKANGQSVSRTTYASLFAAIGTTYGTGDGSSTFNLPELRGEFIRGWDDGRGVDTGRTLGSKQKGSLAVGDDGNGANSLSFATSFATQYQHDTPVAADYPGTAASSANAENVNYYTFAGASAYFGVVRPRNVALLYCIKE